MNDGLKTLLAMAVAGGLVFLGSRLLRSRSKDGSASDPPFPRAVALLGDSLTGGPEYAAELRRLLGPDSEVRAFSYQGKGAAFIRGKLEEALAYGPTDLVVLAGINDLASGRSPAHIIAQLNDIYVTAREQGVRVVGVGLIPWGCHHLGAEKISETYEVNEWISWSSPADFVDTTSMGDGANCLHPALAAPDNLHLNTIGQRALAQEVFIQAFGGR